jgi:hypothetical protein
MNELPFYYIERHYDSFNVVFEKEFFLFCQNNPRVMEEITRVLEDFLYKACTKETEDVLRAKIDWTLNRLISIGMICRSNIFGWTYHFVE